MMLRQRRWVRAVAAVCLVTFTAGCASSAVPPPDEVPTPAEARLRPGDVIQLEIWREPDLSGRFAVDERGEAILPKIGVTAATDVPTTELERRIRDGFAEYLRNPSITITFLRRITVSGAVRAPGIY
ncbi:MAG: polysaccharide biosynthesis/export family protein, partial [Gemmatimonadota bacterium]